MNKISREIQKCKYKAFGKVKSKIRKNNNNPIDELVEKKDEMIRDSTSNNVEKIYEIEVKIAKKIHEEQNKLLEKDVRDLKNMKNIKGNISSNLPSEGQNC